MKSNLNYSDIQSHPNQKSRKQTTNTNQQGREGKGTLLTADAHVLRPQECLPNSIIA